MIRRRYLDTSTMPEGSRSIEERRPYSLAAQTKAQPLAAQTKGHSPAAHAHEKAAETTAH